MTKKYTENNVRNLSSKYDTCS